MELLQSNKLIIGNTIYASTKWFDDRCVQLLSNIVGAETSSKGITKQTNRMLKFLVQMLLSLITNSWEEMGCKGIPKIKCMKCNVYLCFIPS